MSEILYRASFYLYEISFLIFAAALWYNSLALRKVGQALRQPAYWIFSALGAVLLGLCAINHYVVYHQILPEYLRNETLELLIQMYVMKTISMGCILGAGVSLILANLGYFRRMIK